MAPLYSVGEALEGHFFSLSIPSGVSPKESQDSKPEAWSRAKKKELISERVVFSSLVLTKTFYFYHTFLTILPMIARVCMWLSGSESDFK